MKGRPVAGTCECLGLLVCLGSGLEFYLLGLLCSHPSTILIWLRGCRHCRGVQWRCCGGRYADRPALYVVFRCTSPLGAIAPRCAILHSWFPDHDHGVRPCEFSTAPTIDSAKIYHICVPTCLLRPLGRVPLPGWLGVRSKISIALPIGLGRVVSIRFRFDLE